MIPSLRKAALRASITRCFESSRLQEQSIAAAYRVLVPVISRRAARPRSVGHESADPTIRRPASQARGA
jgi:hypothetical protein